jgi:hypothetical protein
VQVVNQLHQKQGMQTPCVLSNQADSVLLSCGVPPAVDCIPWGAPILPTNDVNLKFSFAICPAGQYVTGSIICTGLIWDQTKLTCNSPLSAGVTGGTQIAVGGTGGSDMQQKTTTTGFIKARLTTAPFSGNTCSKLRLTFAIRRSNEAQIVCSKPYRLRTAVDFAS